MKIGRSARGLEISLLLEKKYFLCFMKIGTLKTCFLQWDSSVYCFFLLAVLSHQSYRLISSAQSQWPTNHVPWLS